jgi:hypothetical protein
MLQGGNRRHEAWGGNSMRCRESRVNRKKRNRHERAVRHAARGILQMRLPRAASSAVTDNGQRTTSDTL